MTDYYKLLGVSSTATAAEIKKAYRRLALQFHPDRNPGDKNSEAYFKKITEAYNTLSDQQERNKYDSLLKSRLHTPTQEKYEQKQHHQITPQLILKAIQDISRKVIGVEKVRIHPFSLHNSLNSLLNPDVLNFLLATGDVKVNKQIISEVLSCYKFLPHQLTESLSMKLVKLAGSDNDAIEKIFSKSKKLKQSAYWKKYGKAALAVAIILALLIFYYGGDNFPAISSNKTSYQPSNGDLDNTFSNDKSLSTELTAEQKLEIQKDSMIADGWKEKSVQNGQLPACYNFIPKKGNVDNYLEVHVGGGTDVAIKIMNLQTDRCVRYVFINSGTIYKIRNIPEGIYYLKIAYGKNWFSKVDGGQCVGKFILNTLYERGNDMMDFRIQHTSDGYRIPNFQLKLDVIASNTINTFDSQSISETEFNR